MKLAYGTVHRILDDTLGRAGDRTCPCGEPAIDWAYQHDAEQEFRSPQGYVYSTDVTRYLAMCRSCHSFLDSLPRARPQEPELVVETDPRWIRQRRQEGVERAQRTIRARRAADPEYDEAMRENSRVNGLAMQERHLEKLDGPEYAARSRAASVANLAVANQKLAARRAADPDFDAKMRAMHQEEGRKAGLKTVSMKRKCKGCSVEGSPPSLGRHQKASGHEGWTDAREDGGSDLR